MKIIVFPLLIFVILAFRFHYFYQTQPVYKGGQQVSLQTTLQEEPELSNRGQTFSIKTSTNQRMYVNANSFPRYHYGEVIHVSGELQAVTK